MLSALRRAFRPNAHTRRVMSGLCDTLTLVTYGGVGFGNPYHND